LKAVAYKNETKLAAIYWTPYDYFLINVVFMRKRCDGEEESILRFGGFTDSESL
jgi:hypothetical protein